MLKNELEILSSGIPPNSGAGGGDSNLDRSFAKMVSESCGRAREAWAAAAFSASSDVTLCRYFNFHFRYLSDLVQENTGTGDAGDNPELCRLMDHLIAFYGRFIDLSQAVSSRYFSYRIGLLLPVYALFFEQLRLSAVDDELKVCLHDCLRPLYHDGSFENPVPGAILYRIALISALAGLANAVKPLTTERVVGVLMSLNFNHFLFLDYLRGKVLSKLQELPAGQHAGYLLKLGLAIPDTAPGSNVFDARWPGIATMYKSWLNDYRVVFCLTGLPEEAGSPVTKVPLNISVKYLACMIRALYESGFYGNITLSAIFDHAAAVFSTKRQQHISSDSLSNAYYSVSQQTAARMIGVFDGASAFLKSCYFPR